MPGDWHVLLSLAVAVVVAFPAAMLVGLRYAMRRQARNLREVRAPGVLSAAGVDPSRRADLLYGVWRTSVQDVVLRVRDGDDADIATIAHRVVGADIVAGNARYRITVSGAARESASLMDSGGRGAASDVLCTFELRGWGGRRVARYTLADGSILTVRGRWSAPWKRAPLAIEQHERTIGQLFAIGSEMRNDGRAVLLPNAIPLPVRLFILYKAVGARVATSRMT